MAAGDLEKAINATPAESAAIHAVVGGGVAALGGGDALQGALGAGAAEAANPLTASWAFNADGTPSSVGRLEQNAVSSLIGGIVGGGAGAATALYGDEYNRQLHVDESEAIHDLAQKGYDENELQAVACVMVHCLNGRGLTDGSPLIGGAAPSLTTAGQQLADQYTQVLSQMTPAQQAQYQSVLQNTGLFRYSWSDAWSDAWSDTHGTTRLQGLLQAAGAFSQMYVYSKIAGSSPIATGVAIGGTAEVSDQMGAGISTWWTGNANPSLQNQLYQELGLSPSQASVAETLVNGATGIAAGGLAIRSGSGSTANTSSQQPQPPQPIGNPPSNAGAYTANAPWLDDVSNYTKGGTFLQCGNGSCVSATAQNITNGAVTESQMVSQIGEWSNAESLAGALNQGNVNGGGWIGGMVSEGNTLRLASNGIIGAELQAPGVAAHMVAIEPVAGAPGKFLVLDTGVGASYTVDSAWITKYVSKVVAQP